MAYEVKPRAKELLGRMNGDRYADAYRKGINLSTWLTRELGEERIGDVTLDGFEQIMAAADIRTRAIPEEGVWANQVAEAWDHDNLRALLPEFCARQWRKVSLAPSSKRAVYLSSDSSVGSLMRPYDEEGGARIPRLTPPIPLDELVAVTTPLEGTDAYKAMYLVDDAAQQRMVRVGEGAEIPRAKLTTGEITVRVKKFGRALEATYEQIRRMRFDMLAFHVQRLAARAQMDKVAAVADVIVNGDGNPSTAATATNISTLDAAATGGAVTLKGWLAWKLKWAAPYQLTHILLRESDALKLMLLNTGSANIPLVMIQGASGFGGLIPMNNQLADSVRFGISNDVANLAITGIDARYAIERVYEVGADIQEVTRFISRQTEMMTFTEAEGYSKLEADAARVLNLA